MCVCGKCLDYKTNCLLMIYILCSMCTLQPTPHQIMLVIVMYIADIDDFFDVKRELVGVAHNWKGIGEALRLKPSVLDSIEDDGKNAENRMNKVLTEWLKKAYNTTRFGPPSWKLLAAAVAHPAGGNNHALAEEIAHKYKGINTS